jgi:hypothetical protein
MTEKPDKPLNTAYLGILLGIIGLLPYQPYPFGVGALICADTDQSNSNAAALAALLAIIDFLLPFLLLIGQNPQLY